jgi:hypothetical protein
MVAVEIGAAYNSQPGYRMEHINLGRVIVGGLVAGLIINVVAAVTNGVLLQADWTAAMQALGRPGEATAAQITGFNIWGFAVGIIGVWLYAAARPRFGAGQATAIKIGFVTWLLGYFLANALPYISNLLPLRILAIDALTGLLGVVGGTVAGAYLYREGAESAEQLRAKTAKA